MATEKNIKINFGDGGSLNKLKQSWEELSRSIVGKSINFGQNAPGTFNVQSGKYIKDEIEDVKKLINARKDEFESRKRQFRELDELEKRAGNRKTPEEERNKLHAEAVKRRREILSGTGYRREDTFLKGASGQISKDEEVLRKMEKLLEDSNSILKDILSNDKESALKEVREIERNKDATAEERLAAAQARNALDGVKKNKTTQSNLISDLFQFSNLNNLLTSATGALGSKDSVEATRRAGQAAIEAGIAVGDIATNVLAGIADRWAGKGTGNLIRSGGQLLSRAGGAFASLTLNEKLDSYISRQNFHESLYANQALTGRMIMPYQASQYGYSLMDSANLGNSLMRSAGSFRGASAVQNAQLLERGFGIDTSLSAALLELTRTNKETDKNLINIVGGIYNSGKEIFKGDRTFLGEFITNNFSSLQRELLRNQSSVNSGLVMNVLTQFAGVGGQFNPRHPNAAGLLSSINNSLATPSGDTMDALSFIALRNAMPGASLGDILRERQKGLGSSKYFNSFISQLENMTGGNEDSMMIQVANALGINYDAATSLVRNRDKIKSFSDTQLSGYIGNLQQNAESQTTLIQRQNSELMDAQIMGAFDKIKTLIDQMKKVWSEAWDGATYTFDPATKQFTISSNTIVNNDKKPPVGSNNKLSQIASKYSNGNTSLDLYGAIPRK